MTHDGSGFFDRISARTAENYPSDIHKLFASAGIPGIISFAGGAPHLGELPFDELAEWAGDILTGQGGLALQYSAAQGLPVLRESIVSVMRMEGIEAEPDDVVVTAGSQLGLDLVTKTLVDPGDVIIAEAPSYAGGLGVLPVIRRTSGLPTATPTASSRPRSTNSSRRPRARASRSNSCTRFRASKIHQIRH